MTIFDDLKNLFKPKTQLAVATGYDNIDLSAEDGIEEGYKKNPVARRCIEEIADAVADIEIDVAYKNKSSENDPNQQGNPEEKHPLLALLERPNEIDTYDSFIKRVVTDYFLKESYIERISDGQKYPTRLTVIDPSKVSVDVKNDYFPDMYTFAGVKEKKYIFDIKTKQYVSTDQYNPMLVRLYNPDPTDRFKALPPIQSVIVPVMLYNQAMKWNWNLLANGGNPSMVFTSPQPDNRTQIEREQIVEMLEKRYINQNMNGRPMVAFGLDIKQIGFSPAEMHFQNLVQIATRHIIIGLGVPEEMIIADNSSYNNKDSAKKQFYLHTAVPLLQRILGTLTYFMSDVFPDVYLRPKPESVEKLTGTREQAITEAEKLLNMGIQNEQQVCEQLGLIYEPSEFETPTAEEVPMPEIVE